MLQHLESQNIPQLQALKEQYSSYIEDVNKLPLAQKFQIYKTVFTRSYYTEAHRIVNQIVNEE